jgi:hypothetical protein
LRRFGFQRPGVIAALASALIFFPLAGAAWAPSGHNWNSQMPFTGTIRSSVGGETVELSGRMHVVVDVSGTETTGFNVGLHANLDETAGTGETSGQPYIGDGADQASVQLAPGPLAGSVSFSPSFVLHPPSPCRIGHPPGPCHATSALGAHVTVSFNTDGTSVVVALDDPAST